MATCKLEGYIVTGTSTGIESYAVYATPFDSPALIANTELAISPEPITAITSSTGYFELNLIQNVKFNIIIPEIGLRRTILIPTSTGPVSIWS